MVRLHASLNCEVSGKVCCSDSLNVCPQQVCRVKVWFARLARKVCDTGGIVTNPQL